MSEKKDKPADFDPDATVMQPGARPAEAHDPDATVMMGSRKDLTAPDEDATVMMSAGLGKGEPPAEPPARVPLAAFQRDDDPDATVIGAQPAEPVPEPAAVPPTAAPPTVVAAVAPAVAAAVLATPVSADTSRMPMIAGGAVVLAVALYIVFGGGKPPAPEAPKPAVAVAPAPAVAPAVTPPAAPAASASAVSVKALLADDIKRGVIAVAEERGATTITLRSANQFHSGGVDIEAPLRPAILGIAAALDKAPGSIVVTGHADAKPSSNPKFPSNQELSAARGESVAKLIAGKLRDPKRVQGEGAGDSQQVAPSDTAGNRAKNRRVVIVLRPAS